MKQLLFVLGVALALTLGVARAQADDLVTRLPEYQVKCYGISSMASLTVGQRNAGRTFEQQMAPRVQRLGGADSVLYKLVEDLTRQIYDKDVRDARRATADAHRSCLTLSRKAEAYTEQAMLSCPAIGLMVVEVWGARRRGEPVERVVERLSGHYGDLAQAHDGGLEGLAARFGTTSPPESGLAEYAKCMAQGAKEKP